MRIPEFYVPFMVVLVLAWIGTFNIGFAEERRVETPAELQKVCKVANPGDLIVIVEIQTPKSLTAQEKELLENFADMRGEQVESDNSNILHRIGEKLFRNADGNR